MHIGLVIAKLFTMVLGILIAHQAYRGYRIHENKPMFYVSVGFVFISIGAVIEGLLFDVAGLDIYIAGTVQTATVAIGMIVILYSLYGNLENADRRNDD